MSTTSMIDWKKSKSQKAEPVHKPLPQHTKGMHTEELRTSQTKMEPYPTAMMPLAG